MTWEDDVSRGRATLLRRFNLTTAQRAYEDAFGRAAQERQTLLALTLYPCCGEPRDGEHHLACSKRPAETGAAVHADQGALL